MTRESENMAFDRELDQYCALESELEQQLTKLQTWIAENRDWSHSSQREDLVEMLEKEAATRSQLTALRVHQQQYLDDKERLVNWGLTDEWVVAGSIVTVRHDDGEHETYVLTERPSDPEHEPLGYDSSLGLALRRRRVGDRVEYGWKGSSVLIVSISPGFREPSARPRPNRGRAQATSASTSLDAADIPRRGRALHNQQSRRVRFRHIWDPHVEQVNSLVERIERRENARFMPRVDPLFGGVEAEVLILLKSPQADADEARGQFRLLSLDNNDSGAELLFDTLRDVNLDRRRCVAWNICAFPIKGRNPTEAELSRGREDLADLLGLLPRLKCVVALGVYAQRNVPNGLRRADGRRIEVFEGPSPFPPGIGWDGALARLASAFEDAQHLIDRTGR
ncbi:hypothetical protein G3I13_19760 [Streptomyces sp. SID6673]|nr:hypothetical protein [Streptomyces sp. SID11726]NEB26575.1 hypothetical protein [Streptomyces sp. SID6673]